MQKHQVRHLVEEYESERVKDPERYDSGDYDCISDVANIGARGVDIGLGHLALGNCQLGRQWLAAGAKGDVWKFEKSVESNLDFNQPILANAYLPAMNGLVNAALSRNHGVQETVVAEVKSLLEEIPSELESGQHLMPFISALCSLISDDGDAGEDITRIRTRAETETDQLGSIRAELARSLSTRNASTLRQGMEDLLEYHQDFLTEDESIREIRRHISHEGAAYMEIADCRDIHVEMDSEFLPDCVME